MSDHTADQHGGWKDYLREQAQRGEEAIDGFRDELADTKSELSEMKGAIRALRWMSGIVAGVMTTVLIGGLWRGIDTVSDINTSQTQLATLVEELDKKIALEIEHLKMDQGKHEGLAGHPKMLEHMHRIDRNVAVIGVKVDAEVEAPNGNGQ